MINGVANSRLAAWDGNQPAILLTITKSIGANVLQTIARIRQVLPLLRSWMPADVDLKVISDRTSTIRASVDDVQYTLLLAVGWCCWSCSCSCAGWCRRLPPR